MDLDLLLDIDPVVRRAYEYAEAAHSEVQQRRKYTGAPYIEHPASVARIMANVIHDPSVLAAALLHDVVEDTNRTLDDVRAAFGDVVADYVSQVTDVSKPSDGNRKVRKAIDAAHAAAACSEMQTLKYADFIDNFPSINKYDPNFAAVYAVEKMVMMRGMQRGNYALRSMVYEMLAAYFAHRAGVAL